MGSIDTTRDRWAPRRGPVALILVGLLALTACSGDDDDAASSATLRDSDTEATAEETAEMSEPTEVAAAEGGVMAAGDSAEVPMPTQGDGGFGVIGRDVIVEMRVVLSSDDIARTVASVMASASSLGGGVASSDVDYGNDATGSEGYAVIVVKVPPDSVGTLLSGLDDTGTVQSINQSARDVTEQLVDLDVRIDNARQSVTNVREFMDRTENLNELVTLEAELTRRQTDLERLEAQQRDLADRVALSTITIEVLPTASVPEPPAIDDDGIGDALRSGWDAFTAMLFGIGYVIAVTLPFIVAGLLLAMIAWLIIGRSAARGPDRVRSHRTPAAEPPPADDAEAHEPESEPVG